MTLIIKDLWEDALAELGKPDAIITPIGTSAAPDFQTPSFEKARSVTEELYEKSILTTLFTGWHPAKAKEVAERQGIDNIFCEAGCVRGKKVAGKWNMKSSVYSEYASLMDEGAGKVFKAVVEDAGKAKLAMNIQPDMVSLNLQPNAVAYCIYVNPPRKVFENDLSKIIKFQEDKSGPSKIREAEIPLYLDDEVIGQTIRDLSRLFNFQPVEARKDKEKIYLKQITQKKAIEIAEKNKISPDYIDEISKEAVKGMQKFINLHGIREVSPHIVSHDDNCVDVFPMSKGLAVLDAAVDTGYKNVILIEKGSGHESWMNKVFNTYGGIKAVALCPSDLENKPDYSIPVPNTKRDNLYRTVGSRLLTAY